MNIASVVVMTKPGSVRAVAQNLATLPGVEIHHTTEDGRLIVTLEGEDGFAMSETIKRFHTEEGVISAALVYHHAEDSEDVHITTHQS